MTYLKTMISGMGLAVALFSSCASNGGQQLTKSGLDPAKFDTLINEKPVKLYTLTNASGMEACITNYGGRVVSLMVPDRDGKLTDVVLGFDNIHQYADTQNSPSDYGSSVGRYANRIGKGRFQIGDSVYQLKQNDGENCLHGGGDTGWMNQVYDAEQIGDSILRLTIVAKDGENGFPGEVVATTTYKLTSDNTLDITWEAEGTPMDFRQPHAVGDSIHSDYDQVKNAGGYDHNYCLNTFKDGKGDDTQVCASLYSPKTGILMEMRTNEPGVQVYSGNFQGVGRDADIVRKHGIKYPQHVSICLESQKFPDSPNKKDWVQPLLMPGEKYYSHAAYTFKVKSEK